MMEDKTRERYVSPHIEVIPMETEGCVMTASSGALEGLGNGGNWGTQTRSTGRQQYNAASDSDIEDLINDILTVEQ